MATLTVSMVSKTTGLNTSTIHNYIRSGKIHATLLPNHLQGEYRIDESELEKLPKPLKRRVQLQEQKSESEVPQVPPFLTPVPMMRVIEGTPEQIVAYYRAANLRIA